MKHLSLLTLLLMLCLTATAQPQSQRQREDRYGRNALRQTDPTFLQSEDGRRIGDQVLLWQRNTGGWPKNIDMASPMTEERLEKCIGDFVIHFSDRRQKTRGTECRQEEIYSTDPDFSYSDGESEDVTLPRNQQKLRVSMERSGRGGKSVTLVKSFIGTETDLMALGKLLKQKCGVGGSEKEGEIIIQGDHRDRLVEILKKEGYTQTK